MAGIMDIGMLQQDTFKRSIIYWEYPLIGENIVKNQDTENMK